MYEMGIRGVTRGYRGLQGVTWGYNGLQRVTGGYKGLQGVRWVKKDYRNFSLTRTFPDTFLALFCIKTKVEEISNFLPKRWTNPFGKILILCFS